MEDDPIFFRMIVRQVRAVGNSVTQRIRCGTGCGVSGIRGTVPTFGLSRDSFIWGATWFLTFYLTALAGVLIVFPVIYPLDLLRLELHLYPLAWITNFGILIVLISLLVWGYRRLRSPAIVEAQRAAGFAPPHIWGVFSGIVLAMFLAVFLMVMSVWASKAIELAQLQTGPGYKFHVPRIECTPNRCLATVKAYNETEIRYIKVKW